MRCTHLLCALLCLGLALSASPSFAQPPRPAPMPPLPARDLALLERLVHQGRGAVVGLVELTDGVPAIQLVTEVDASFEQVIEVLRDPERWPEFMPAMSEVSVRERHGPSTGFTWRWQTAVFQLSGEAAISVLLPRPAHRDRGARILVERLSGDLGTGRESWRIIPRGEDRTLLILESRMDLRDANYLTRRVGRGGPSISRSANITMSSGMMLRVRAEAERRAGRPEAAAATRTLDRPPLDARAFEEILHRAELLFIEAEGASLRQASVMTRLPHPEARVREIMLDPIAFTEALIVGSHAEIVETLDDGVRFDWRVDIPLMGSGGRMTLREAEDGLIHLDAEDGAMRGGRWRFATTALTETTTAVLGWASFDVADTNFLIRAIIDADEGFRPGLSGATEIMMARALRIRLSR